MCTQGSVIVGRVLEAESALIAKKITGVTHSENVKLVIVTHTALRYSSVST